MAAPSPLQGRADCEANFELIRSWIAQCKLHPVCAHVPYFTSKFQLPTRLIDIGTTTGATPRLILSSDLDEAADCRYVTLSHCWGDASKVPKTTSATFAQHQEKITGLSKTFEDAIEVTRQIGVRYLWIDSLCIIQQDTTDWEVECSRMSLIYARAYCRLSTRGWAFQEHQLSTRIVHFTKSRLLWECRKYIAYEDSPIQMPRFLCGGGDTFAVWRLFDIEREKHERNTNVPPLAASMPRSSVPLARTILDHWLMAIERYSSRSLTVPGDRLPAISGLAAAVSLLLAQDEDDSKYLAGLWRRDIARGLLWKRTGSAPKLIPGRQLTIPSWSWASYAGPVKFLAAVRNLDDFAEYYVHETRYKGLPRMLSEDVDKRVRKRIKCSTTLSTLDPFGHVMGGMLQIDTRARDVTLARLGPESSWTVVDKDFGYINVTLDYPDAAEILEATLALVVADENLKRTTWGGYGLVLSKDQKGNFRRAGIFYLREALGTPGFKFSRLTII